MINRIHIVLAMLGGLGLAHLYSSFQRRKLYVDLTKGENIVEKDGLKFSISPVEKNKSVKFFELEIENSTSEDIELIWTKTYFLERGQTAGAFYTISGNRRSTELLRPDIVFAGSSFKKTLYPCIYSHDKVIPPIPGTGMVTSQVISWEENFKEGQYGVYITYKRAEKEFSEKLTFTISRHPDESFADMIKKFKVFGK